MKDTLEILKGLVTDPLPYVNTIIFLGLSSGQWDLLFKIVIGTATTVWTAFKILNEIKKYRKNGRNY